MFSELAADLGDMSSDNGPDYVPETETDSMSEGVYVPGMFY